MPPTAARATAVVGVLLVSVGIVVGLAGCSPDEPTPIATLTASATPRVTPSGTPTPTPAMPSPVASPTLPVEWQDDGEAGAEEAARYFLNLYAYTQSTQDVEPWTSASHADCVFCQSVLTDVASRRAHAQVVAAAPVAVLATSSERVSEGAFKVVIRVSTGPDDVWSRDGVLLEAGQRSSGTMTFLMLREQESWLVREVQLEQDQ